MVVVNSDLLQKLKRQEKKKKTRSKKTKTKKRGKKRLVRRSIAVLIPAKQ
jgi:hypothetical protein